MLEFVLSVVLYIAPGMDIVVSVEDTPRGYAVENSIVIPEWTEKYGTDYIAYYTAHEVAHVLSTSDHGEEYQKTLKELVPNLYHYEAAYSK